MRRKKPRIDKGKWKKVKKNESFNPETDLGVLLFDSDAFCHRVRVGKSEAEYEKRKEVW